MRFGGRKSDAQQGLTHVTLHVTSVGVIRTFRHKGLEGLYLRGEGRRLPAEMLPRIRVLLNAVSLAKTLDDLNVASYRLHQLKGDLKGNWSISVRANWRMIFRFEGGDAFDVDFVDCH
jgi:toxin HigB-1